MDALQGRCICRGERKRVFSMCIHLLSAVCTYLAVTSIHFRVQVHLAPFFPLFFSFPFFFVLVFIFQALPPHTHGTGQHHTQTHNAQGSSQPWRCCRGNHTWQTSFTVCLHKWLCKLHECEPIYV